MRTFFIWVFGLASGAVLGMLIGYTADRSGGSAVFGLMGGMAVFACLRLWLAAPKQPSESP